MRYVLIDMGDEFVRDDAERYGVVDLQHREMKDDPPVAKIVANYLQLDHAKILIEGLNKRDDKGPF